MVFLGFFFVFVLTSDITEDSWAWSELGCQHRFPNFVPSRGPLLQLKAPCGSGGCHRSAPTGAVPYGMPRKSTTSDTSGEGNPEIEPRPGTTTTGDSARADPTTHHKAAATTDPHIRNKERCVAVSNLANSTVGPFYEIPDLLSPFAFSVGDILAYRNADKLPTPSCAGCSPCVTDSETPAAPRPAPLGRLS